MSKLDLTCQVGEETPRFPTLPILAEVECQEVENIIGEHYVRCAKPSVMLVYHARDRRTYPMCQFCGWHNTENRGGIQVAELRREP